jgi:hypothetical protein
MCDGISYIGLERSDMRLEGASGPIFLYDRSVFRERGYPFCF